MTLIRHFEILWWIGQVPWIYCQDFNVHFCWSDKVILYLLSTCLLEQVSDVHERMNLAYLICLLIRRLVLDLTN